METECAFDKFLEPESLKGFDKGGKKKSDSSAWRRTSTIMLFGHPEDY